jgi:hypothetical protein
MAGWRAVGGRYTCAYFTDSLSFSMKQPYYLLLAAAALLTSCQKDSERIAYSLSGVYTAENTLRAANPIGMYTSAGQVTNAAVITRFLAKRQNLSDYFSTTDVAIPSNTSLRLVFRANNRATLLSTAPNYSDSIRAEVTDQQVASLRLQNLDSVTTLASASYSCTKVSELAGYIKEVYPGKRCRNLPLASGYSQYCRQRPVRVVGARGSQLYVPYFSWLVQADGCFVAYSGEWNMFNRAVLNHLAAGDTVVVQEREIALRK